MKKVKSIDVVTEEDLIKIQKLVGQYYKADSGGLKRRAKHYLTKYVIDLFSINKENS